MTPAGGLSRRQFLAASAAVGVAGIEGIVAARRAPAYAQGTRLHLLQWSHFVPAADTLFETQAKEFGIDAVTTLNDQPGVQAFHLAPLAQEARTDPDGMPR